MRKGNTFLGGLYKSGQYIGEVYKGNTLLNSFGFPKTVSGDLPLTLPAPRSKPLNSVKIKPYLAQNGITVNGKLYKVADGVTILDSATSNSNGFKLDFGITPKLTTKVRIVFTPVTSNGSGFGGARCDPDYVRFSITTFSSGAKLTFAFTKNTWSNNKTDLVVGKRYDCTAYNGKQIINGTEYNETVHTSLPATDTTFKIAALDNNGAPSTTAILNAKYELYYIWEGDAPVLLAHPAIKNNVVGFYDLVAGKFFAPTVGTLTAGKTTKTVNVHSEIPSEYQELTCADNNGEAWLDLGLPIGSTDVVAFDVAWNTGKSASFFGAYDSGGSFNCNSFVGTYFAASSKKGFYNNTASISFCEPTIGERGILKWNGLNKSPTYNGFAFGATPVIDFTPSVNAYLCTRNQGGNAGSVDDMTIYHFKADGKCDLYPVERLSDNKVGFYDTIRKTFLVNQGTGADFTGGSAYQMEVPICSVERSGEKTAQLFDKATMGTQVNVGLADVGTARYATASVQSRSFVIAVEPNTNYNVSVQGTFEGAMFRVATTATLVDSKHQTVSTIAHTNKTSYSDTTINSGANAQYLYIQFSSAAIDTMKDVLVVVKGTTAPTKYISYGYEYDTIISGRNLVDLTAITDGYYYNDSGVYTATSDARLTDWINAQAGEPYTFTSILGRTGTPRIRMCFFDENQNYISQQNTNVSATLTATAPAGTAYIRVSANYKGNLSIDWSGVMLVEDSVAPTQHEPYFCQTIETYTEMLQGSVGLVSGVETEEWDCTTLDENANWTDASSGTKHIYYAPISGRKASEDYRYGFSSQFVFSNGSSSTAQDNSMFYYGSSNTGFRMDSIASLDDWKALVSAIGGIKVWFPKTTPTTSQGAAHTIQGHGTTAIIDCAESKQGEASYLSKLA